MKWLTVVTLVFAGYSAQALTLTLNKQQLLNPKTIKVELKNSGGGTSPGQPGPVEPIPVIPPTRTGRMKFEVVKNQTIKNSDGSYTMTTTPVCMGEEDMPVFDVRNVTEGYFAVGILKECDTTYDGQPVKIAVSGHLSIYDRERFGENVRAEKSGAAGIYILNASNGYAPWLFSHNPGTRDLANRSLIGSISQQIEVCSPTNDGTGDISCEINIGESFYASYELIDNP